MPKFRMEIPKEFEEERPQEELTPDSIEGILSMLNQMQDEIRSLPSASPLRQKLNGKVHRMNALYKVLLEEEAEPLKS